MTIRTESHLDVHLRLVLFALIIGGAFLKLYGYDTFGFTIWSDRLLLRAAQLFDDFQVSGAELYLTQGARAPGGAMYYFYNLIININDSPQFIYLVGVFFDFIATYIIYYVFKKHFGFNFGLIAAALYSTSANVFNLISLMWNPSLLPFFSVLCLMFMFKIFVEKSYNYVPILFFTIFIGIQFHISLFILVFIFLALLLVFPIRPSIRQIGLALLLAAVSLSPYIIAEFQNDFDNTKRMFTNNAHTILDSYNLFTNFFAVVWQTILQVRVHSTLIFNVFHGNIPTTFAGLVYFSGSILIVALFLGYYISLIVRLIRNRRTQDPDDRRHHALVLMVVIYGACIIISQFFSNQKSQIEARHVMAYMPAAIGIMSLFLIEFNGWIQTSLIGIVRRCASAVLSIVVLLGAGYWSMGYFNPKIGLFSGAYSAPFYRYRLVDGVVQTVRDEFQFSNEKLERAVAIAAPVVAGGEIKLEHVSDFWTAFSYLVNRLPPPAQDIGDSYSGCALIVLKDVRKNLRFDAAPGKILAITHESFDDDLIVTVERVIERDDFVLVGFPNIHGNCPRTFANGYILTDNEKEIARGASRLTVDTAVAQPSPDAGNRVYLMRLQNPATKIGGSDMGIRLTVRTTGPQVSALLESGDLTGPFVSPPNGVLLDSDLIFVDKESGASVRLPINRRMLGGGGAFTSPWQTASILLESGDYTVTFRGRVSTSEIFLTKSVDVSIRLDDNFSIRN